MNKVSSVTCSDDPYIDLLKKVLTASVYEESSNRTLHAYDKRKGLRPMVRRWLVRLAAVAYNPTFWPHGPASRGAERAGLPKGRSRAAAGMRGVARVVQPTLGACKSVASP